MPTDPSRRSHASVLPLRFVHGRIQAAATNLEGQRLAREGRRESRPAYCRTCFFAAIKTAYTLCLWRSPSFLQCTPPSQHRNRWTSLDLYPGPSLAHSTATDLPASFFVKMGAVLSQVLWGVQVTGPLNVAARDVNNHIHYHRVESADDVDMPSILESVPNFRGIQIATLGRATPGTGLWIIECETFRLWLDPDGWLRIMWGYGMPGAGKTVAASIVINALEVHASQSTSPVCICYIYFRYSDHTKATTQSFLEVLVKQTLERHPGCLPLFNKVYARHTREKTQPSEEELLGLLRQFTAAMVTFYLLDALDEAPTAIQIEIIQRLTSLNVKLFITSRPLKDVEAAFPNVHRFPIVAQPSDIDLHIEKEISLSGNLRAILAQGGTSLRDKVYASIREKCGGMFLHASLQLATLLECPNICEVKKTLAIFPTDIEDLYHKTWRRILDLAPAKSLLARNTLTWVVHSTRSLTIEELLVAVATCPDTHRFEQDRLVQEETLIGLCHGLVAVEEETRLVRLVHYTAKDTLEHLIIENSPRPHALLSAVCLARLADSGFLRTKLNYEYELEGALQAEPFLSYVYDSWSTHARQSLADPLTTSRLTDFVADCHAFPVIYYGGWLLLDNFDVLGPLHLVIYFNLPITLAGSDSLRNPNQGTAKRGETALSLACMQGHDDAVKELLHLPNILVNSASVDGTTALMWASIKGHEGAARLLIACPGLNINATEFDRWTALMWVSGSGHQGMVELFLSRPDIAINMRNENGSTGLAIASVRGHEEVVMLLLSCPDVDVNAADQDKDTALTKAAKNGKESVVKLLLAHPSIQVGTRELEAARNGYSWSAERTGEAHLPIVSLLEEFLTRT
ncbi:hypothetical protein BKA70DRAFT_1474968 [Coprinopsis sp. MPI-PUGE-AT-0042]|nr:hypothetical protein BKA70DRAFT_1474968 [Coprinopsis sp. MPI-PUGE-AT-0042]